MLATKRELTHVGVIFERMGREWAKLIEKKETIFNYLRPSDLLIKLDKKKQIK